MADWPPEKVEQMRQEMRRADWLCNTGRRPYDECVEAGSKHQWQPLSFVFESQLLDYEGRVLVRQPNTKTGRVYVVCMACHSHTYIETKWVGYYIPAAEKPEAVDE